MKNTEQFLKIDEHFPFGPSLLVCQSIDISNQMELTCKVSNLEQKKLIFGIKNHPISLLNYTLCILALKSWIYLFEKEKKA